MNWELFTESGAGDACSHSESFFEHILGSKSEGS